MQALLRSVCRAGTRVASLKPPGVAQSFVEPLRPCSGIRQIVSPNIPHDGVQAYGFCTKALATREFSTVGAAEVSVDDEDSSSPMVEHPPSIKFKRPDKTARHIMNILNKEQVDKVRTERDIPDVQPGCIVQMRVQVPENKRRESTLKGIVIARRNAGIATTFRLRRLVAGVGVESVFPLYSPNIKEIKILDRKKVRRAKLYYLRDRMNALKK
ncbi:unnamed protein product [Alopecurus aequalis]